jgi:hypothetical protein
MQPPVQASSLATMIRNLYTNSPPFGGDDHTYGVAVRQRMEDLKQVLAKDKAAQEKLNTCKGEDCP